jgi:hypothetical protein
VVKNGAMEQNCQHGDDASKCKKAAQGQKGKAKGKGRAKGREVKPKDYDKDLYSRSDNDDNIDTEAGAGAAKLLPNILLLSGFLVAALMEAYKLDANILCFVAMRKRARKAGVDPAQSIAAPKAAYMRCTSL